jgi:predicted glycosyltransferase
MQRILIYSHDTHGMGNIRRTAELCRTMARRIPDVSILIITGSPWVDQFAIPSSVDIVRLPELRRAERGRPWARATGFLSREVQSVRSEICGNVISRFSPDAVLIDKAPFGVDGELRAALDELRVERPDCVRILCLHDILDDPSLVRTSWKRDRVSQEIVRTYDAVWVFGHPDVFDLRSEYSLGDDLAEKVSFLGFLGRTERIRHPSEVRQELDLGTGPLFVVTVGGGEDGRHILTRYAEIIPELRRRHPEIVNVLVTGPRADKAVFEQVSRACEENRGSRVYPFTSRILDLMNAATGVICMSGYDTACEVLFLKKPCVMVPRSQPVLDQRMRAERLERLGAVRVVNPEDLSANRLLEEVETILGGWRPKVLDEKIPFTGLQLAAEGMAHILAMKRQQPARRAKVRRPSLALRVQPAEE